MSWSGRRDLNPGPLAPQASDRFLPNAPQAHVNTTFQCVAQVARRHAEVARRVYGRA
jgi:hypothetical protein